MTDLNRNNDNNPLSDMFKIPFLPSDLPFDIQQSQWLSGFLAGLHSRLAIGQEMMGGVAAQPASAAAAKPLTILVGTQTGNAETAANDCADLAKSHGLTPRVLDMDDVDLADISQAERLLIVTSTYGEGEMPDNAELLWDAISADDAPRFENTFFSVLALGDTSYDEFCLAGKLWDERLELLGATRIAGRIDCDVDYEELAEQWSNKVLPLIAEKGSSGGATVPTPAPAPKKAKSKYNRKNPLSAPLKLKRLETGEGSSKEILHYEFDLAGSGESYDVGDALNIIPTNQPALVDELLAALGASGDETVTWQKESYNARELFTEYAEIRTPSKELIVEIAAATDNQSFKSMVVDSDNATISNKLYGQDIVDLINTYQPKDLTLDVIVPMLKPLAARAYSISSSINKHKDEVHLTIGNVRYEDNGRDHNGVCSTFLADLVSEGQPVKCYFSPNKSFSVPADDDLPMIMVGPGTGIAPFRAFLEEREVRGSKGDNWLFFGDRNRTTDFIYQEELEAMQDSGLLNRLDLAFSRDQAEKIYVQDRMREHGSLFFEWLERGAYFFICGDAFRMAKDVDVALHEIIAEHGDMSADEAELYVAALKKNKRYVRDVY